MLFIMHQTLEKLYTLQFGFQSNLFPHIKEELGILTRFQQKFIEALEISQLDSFIPYIGKRKCRPTKSRMALARAFLAKAIYNMTTTEALIERLGSDLSLRRLCGYENLNQLPSQSTFSRAFCEFAEMGLAEKVHEYIIKGVLERKISKKQKSDGMEIINKLAIRGVSSILILYLWQFFEKNIELRTIASFIVIILFIIINFTTYIE